MFSMIVMYSMCGNHNIVVTSLSNSTCTLYLSVLYYIVCININYICTVDACLTLHVSFIVHVMIVQ